jgi:hypothetical protein
MGAAGHVAAEVEAAEVVAQFLLARLRFEAGHVLQRRFVGAQLFELVLGEVADVASPCLPCADRRLAVRWRRPAA